MPEKLQWYREISKLDLCPALPFIVEERSEELLHGTVELRIGEQEVCITFIQRYEGWNVLEATLRADPVEPDLDRMDGRLLDETEIRDMLVRTGISMDMIIAYGLWKQTSFSRM